MPNSAKTTEECFVTISFKKSMVATPVIFFVLIYYGKLFYIQLTTPPLYQMSLLGIIKGISSITLTLPILHPYPK